jgi:hypothetical protein
MYAVKMIEAHKTLFRVHAVQFATILFQLKDEKGEPSNRLTKELADRINHSKIPPIKS